MMHGAVERLILEAPCASWPMSSHPTSLVHPDQHFMSYMTSSTLRRGGSSDASSSSSPSPLLRDCSRAGFTLLHLGRWSTTATHSTTTGGVSASTMIATPPSWYVHVVNPMTSAIVAFRVLECSPPLPHHPHSSRITSGSKGSKAASTSVITSSTTPMKPLSTTPKQEEGIVSLQGQLLHLTNASIVQFYPRDISLLRPLVVATTTTQREMALAISRRPQTKEEEGRTDDVQPSPASSSSLADTIQRKWHHAYGGVAMEPWLAQLSDIIVRAVDSGATLRTGSTKEVGVGNVGHAVTRSVVITGPSGVGKTTQVRKLLALLPESAKSTPRSQQVKSNKSTKQSSATLPSKQSDDGGDTPPSQSSDTTMIETRFVDVAKAFEAVQHPVDPTNVILQSLCGGGGSNGTSAVVDGDHLVTAVARIVVLDHVDVLGRGSVEPIVTIAAHTISSELEKRHRHKSHWARNNNAASAPTTQGLKTSASNVSSSAATHDDVLVVISLTDDSSALHPLLVTRRALMETRIEATPPSAALRRWLIEQHVATRQQHGQVQHMTPLDVASAVDVMIARSTGWPVSRLEATLTSGSFSLLPTSSSSNPKVADNDDDEVLTVTLPTQATTPGTPHASSQQQLYAVDDIMDRIERLLLFPLQHHAELSASGVHCPRGALVVGPSGSGKTALLSELHRRLSNLVESNNADDGGDADVSRTERPTTAAVDEQQQLLRTNTLTNKLRQGTNKKPYHVVLVDALSLMHKEVGRSEKSIRLLLAEARASAPSVVFLDNLDAIAPPRGKTSHETNVTADRTLSTLLVELDGIRDHTGQQLLVIASAPSVASLDPAMTRPGRLDLHLELSLPTPAALAQLIHRRLADGAVFQPSSDNEQRILRTVEAAFAEARRSLTYADGVAAIRAVALRVFGDVDDPTLTHTDDDNMTTTSNNNISADAGNTNRTHSSRQSALYPPIDVSTVVLDEIRDSLTQR